MTALGLHALSGEGARGGSPHPSGWHPLLRNGVEVNPPPDNKSLSPTADCSACSAITAVGITAALLLHRHQEVGGLFSTFPFPQNSISSRTAPSP